ncbi:MAG: hydroxyisourate hydrolase [Candidatus Eremiobacteraeota bacterium]|nr:hydroxyisourate hydrolase [Candidatus Eremiobacteraeota bacterium]
MLSTHVLDLGRGASAVGVPVALYRIDTHGRTLIAQAHTDADGRVGAPFGGKLTAGRYELVFSVGGAEQFYDEIAVRFYIEPGSTRCHIPLLLSPYGYSTYRGS